MTPAGLEGTILGIYAETIGKQMLAFFFFFLHGMQNPSSLNRD